jgi:transcriptional regulator with XRE-family HTH domain
MPTLGEQIKKLRTDKDLSQDELAKILNMKNRSSIANWEADRISPDNETIKNIADYFNVSIDYLMGRPVSREGDALQSGERVYKVIGSSDFTDDEWERIKKDFETIVALRKAQREKK